jgi:hypothetical protein
MENFYTSFTDELKPKDTFSIECAALGNLGYHFMLDITSPIKVVEISEHEITFKYKHITYVYWADMSIFLKRFWSKEDIRELRLDILL